MESDLEVSFVLLGHLKTKEFLKQIDPELFKSPQTMNCGQDCGDTRQHATTGHVKLPIVGFSHCFLARLLECPKCSGGHLVDEVFRKNGCD